MLILGLLQLASQELHMGNVCCGVSATKLAARAEAEEKARKEAEESEREKAHKAEETRKINERIKQDAATAPAPKEGYKRGQKRKVHRRASNDASSHVRLSEMERIKARLRWEKMQAAVSVAAAFARNTRNTVTERLTKIDPRKSRVTRNTRATRMTSSHTDDVDRRSRFTGRFTFWSKPRASDGFDPTAGGSAEDATEPRSSETRNTCAGEVRPSLV